MKNPLSYRSSLNTPWVPVNLFLQVCVVLTLASCAKGSLINQEKISSSNELSAKDRQARLKNDAKVVDLDYQSYEKAIARGITDCP